MVLRNIYFVMTGQQQQQQQQYNISILTTTTTQKNNNNYLFTKTHSSHVIDLKHAF